jgi:hypothetical protein
MCTLIYIDAYTHAVKLYANIDAFKDISTFMCTYVLRLETTRGMYMSTFPNMHTYSQTHNTGMNQFRKNIVKKGYFDALAMCNVPT